MSHGPSDPIAARVGATANVCSAIASSTTRLKRPSSLWTRPNAAIDSRQATFRTNADESHEADACSPYEMADDEWVHEPAELPQPRREGVGGSVREHLPHERRPPGEPWTKASGCVGRDEQPDLPRHGGDDRAPKPGAEDGEDECDPVVDELRRHFDERHSAVVEGTFERREGRSGEERERNREREHA